MSERKQVSGILLTLAVIVLMAYVLIDSICDRQDEWHMRDLQRRVGQLEEQVRR